jgi:hypothetical protein
MKKKTRISLIFLAIVFLMILLVSCSKSEKETSLATIVSNPSITSISSRDLSKYQLTEKEADPDGATLMSVGFGAEGAYIDVSYKAPPALARLWMQGDVFVVNEKTGVVYADTVLMPVVGWLFQRPTDPDQVASVMLVNHGLKTGDLVTVVLGKYKREHVIVK